MKKRICKTCKHWDNNESKINTSYYSNREQCLICGEKVGYHNEMYEHIKNKHKNRDKLIFGKCRSNKLEIGLPDINSDDSKLIYRDGEDCLVYLFVGQNFGCIHHTFKMKQNSKK